MTHIGHLFDGSTGWEQRVGISQWLGRMPRERYANSLAAVDPAARAPLHHLEHPVDILPRVPGFLPLNTPAVFRFVEKNGVDVIHAWGAQAGRVAWGGTRVPILFHVFDPLVADREAGLLRTLVRKKKFAVVCSCETVRRRFIEGGLPPESTVVIRPAVDFGLINRCRQGPLRKELGMKLDDYVVIVPEPVTRTGGHFEAVWAAVLLDHLSGGVRLVVPGESRERRRIARFAATLPIDARLTMPGRQYPFEQLLAVSDALLVTPRGDVSTTAMAWAMAAGVTVIASAVPSVAELTANGLNGLLFKQVPGRNMSAAIVRLLKDRASQEKVKEVARGQAYEVFGLRRYVEQIMRLYDNVLSGAPPADGVSDPALDA